MNVYAISSRKTLKEENFGDLGPGGKIILIKVSLKSDMTLQIGFI